MLRSFSNHQIPKNHSGTNKHSEEGTKVVLEDRIKVHFDNHPELAEEDQWKKFVEHRIKWSPLKSTHIDVGGALGGPTPTLPSSPAPKLFGIASRFQNAFSSPSKSDKSDKTQEDVEEEEEEEDSDVELISTKAGKLDDEDDAEDLDYEPKTGYLVGLKDWTLEKWESAHDSALDTLDDIFDTVQTNSNGLKASLSTAESVNVLSSAAELFFLLQSQVPVTTIRESKWLDQKIIGKYAAYIDLDWPILDISYLIDFKFILVLLSWFLLAVLGPAIGSYYFNFIGQTNKRVRFDPLAFSLVKLVLAYLFLSGNVSFADVKNNAKVWADEHGLTDSTSLFDYFRAHLFHDSVTLRLILGNTPFVNGFIGVIVALYVAAI